MRCVASWAPDLWARTSSSSLDYWKRVFMEAMRLYPPAPSLMRITRRPIKLGEVELASGATVVIPIYVVH
jgi:cytochrome P450